MAQKKDDENKYYKIIKQTNKETPLVVKLLLVLKSDAIENEIFYLFAIFFRFLGFLIICGNYNNSSSKSTNRKTISLFFRWFCSYGLTEKLQMSNLVYDILSLLIFALLLIMIFFYSKTVFILKNKNRLETITVHKIQIILDHLCFLLFPYIIEFLSFIYYIEFAGNIFIIKKDINSFINIIILILNSISIIFYNIQSFFHILCINNPLDDNNNKIKLNYGRNKIIIINFLQNIIIIESLVLYLSDSYLTIYKTTINIFILAILVVLYFYSHFNFNYITKTNYLINILGIFCFFSIFFEMILYFFGYTVESYLILFFYSIFKIVITFCFDYISNFLYENKMIGLLKEVLFKIYNDKNFPDNNNNNCLYYLNELYRKIKKDNGKANTKKLVNIILLHKSKCHDIECKCKYIEIFPSGKKYFDDYIKHFLYRINYLIESIFVELDYQKNYQLALFLSEHYYNYKNNPILSYSMIQTIIQFNIKSLNISELLNLYTVLGKYISGCSKSGVTVEKNSQSYLENQIFINKETKVYKNLFNSYKNLMKVKKIIKKYATYYLQLIKYKENLEETIQIKKDENNEITEITSYFLTTKNLSNIMKILLGEFNLNTNLIKYLKKLDANKVPIEIIYKCLLFSELFLCGKIPEEIISSLFSINSEINLYSPKVQQNILLSIEELYIKRHVIQNPYYYLIFKFSNGVNIHYFDEALSKKLGFSQKELLNSSFDKIMPKELRIPHNSAMIKHLINEQNIYINNNDIFLFDREMQMYPCLLYGISMPGLGKFLYCITKIFCHNIENKYYFYLGKNLECISLSYNFYKNYHISLNLLNRYKINLLELIDFKFEDLEVLNKDITKINKYKQNLDMITDYFYAQKLFKEKSKYYSGQNSFHLVTLMKKTENYNNEENIELLNNINDDNNKSTNLMEKLINVKYQYKYLKKNLMVKKDKKNRKIFFDKINELMNKFNNENDQSIKKLIALSSKLMSAYGDNTQLENVDFGYFNIQYGLTMIYNTYFYLFKMEEVYKDIPLLTPNENNLDYKKDLISNNSMSPMSRMVGKERSNEKASNKDVNLKSPTPENKKEKITNNIIMHRVQCFDYVVPLGISLLGVLLIIYIIILLYQRNMVTSSYNGFLVYYYNYFQRDQLYSLYSVLLSSYYNILGLTNFNGSVTRQDYKDLIERYSTSFQNSFHQFYNVYVADGNNDITESHTIFEPLEITKIFNYYKENTTYNSYLKESEYLAYISRLIPIEYNETNILDDANNLFLGKIFNKENCTKEETKSYYGKTLYYLSRNFETFYNKVYSTLESESSDKFNKLSNNSKLTYLCIEILGFIIIILFYIMVLFFLYQTNRAIFKNVVNIFINYSQKDNFHYKNKKDNYLLIKIISGFVVLINDFNLDNLHKFQAILYQSTSQTISMNSTFDIRDDNSISFDIPDEEKIRKKEFLNKILDNKSNNATNNSDASKLNLSSSKISLKGHTFGDVLKNLNNPQKSDNNTTNTNNMTTASNKSIALTKTISKKNPLIKTITSNKGIMSKNSINKRKISTNAQEKQKKQKLEEITSNDEEKLTAEIFLKKLVNNGLKEVKYSLIILLVLFILFIVYASLKIIISLNFITEIRGIFEDFGVLAYRYSSMYYYFNSLRTILVFPSFGQPKILGSINANMSDKLKKMNKVLDFKLNKYPAVGNYYWITGTNMKKPRPSESYIDITCYNDTGCRKYINDTRYDVLSEGLKMAVTSMYQQIINIYEDYTKEKDNINNVEFIKEKFINSQYEQIDINLNYVFICIEYRIYEAFMTDLNALANKYNVIIEALNICAVIYCFLVEFIVMIFIIFYLRKITKKVNEVTLRINNAFTYMIKKNSNAENQEDNNNSFNIIDN